MIENIPQEDRAVLGAGLHAPSAHNTQPWLIRQVADRDHEYDLYHRLDDDLPEPQRMISYLNSGALVETLELAAPNYGRAVETTPVLEPREEGLYIARIAIRTLNEGEPIDPLSRHVAGRITNRNRYIRQPLPEELEHTLRGLGNVLLSPKQLSGLVREADIESWADPRFVEDLRVWARTSNEARDGITPAPFNLPPGTQFLLRFAAWRGGFKGFMGRIMAAKDVMTFNNAPVAAVLDAHEDTPAALYDAGKRLVRSWVAITGDGFAYHPFSGPVFYDSTRPKVAEATGTSFPVALYRVGAAAKPQAIPSNRKALEDVLIG